MLVSLKEVLIKAYKNKYAVGAFNINNLEFLKAVLSAAKTQKSPVIISTSEGAIKYAGLNVLYTMIETAAKTPIVLHLDHGKDLNIIKKCIKIGYTGIMFDGSHLPFNKNLKYTKKTVNLAHKKGISVEGELGTIGGKEDLVSTRKIIYTEPYEAKEFVEKTGIDVLAVAIGTSHGTYKFLGKAKLDIERLKKINKLLKIPLVLHGASCIPYYLIKKAEKYGADLGNAEGVPDNQIKTAIKNGICKVNTDTDLRLAFDAGLRKTLSLNPKELDPRMLLKDAKKEIQKVVEHRIKILGSRAKL